MADGEQVFNLRIACPALHGYNGIDAYIGQIGYFLLGDFQCLPSRFYLCP